MHERKFYIYILECVNGTLYTGFTTDIERRYAEHVSGSAKCKYTRSFPPKRLAVYWMVEGTRALGLQLEKKIKQLPKVKKLLLLSQPELFNEWFSITAISYSGFA